MTESNGICSRNATIVNASGLHARSAASIALVARQAKSGVWIRKGGETVSAKDVMDILTLACEKGSVVTLCIEDVVDMGVLNRLATMIQNGFEP